MLCSAIFVLLAVVGHLVSPKVGGAILRLEQPATVIATVFDEEMS